MSDDLKKWERLRRHFEELTNPDGRLERLNENWQREIVSLDRLHAEVWGGSYLQFVHNHGDESLPYARQALKNAEALKALEIVNACQDIVERYANQAKIGRAKYEQLDTRRYIDSNGRISTVIGRMPESQVDKVLEKSERLVELIDACIPNLVMYYHGLAELAGFKP